VYFKGVPTSVMLPVATLCHSDMPMSQHVYLMERRGRITATAPGQATAPGLSKYKDRAFFGAALVNFASFLFLLQAAALETKLR